MDKHDIFTFNVRQYAPNEYLVECALAWDLTKVMRISCTDERQVPYVKIEAMGWLWDVHKNALRRVVGGG